ncbi:MAG: hypothetical protein ACYCWE_08865 [Eubacteriales bacterium]
MKTVTVLLLIILLISLVACSQGQTSDNAVQTADANTQTSDASEITEDLSDNLPDIGYDDADFIIWCDGGPYNNFYDAELTGEVVDDAVYKRNLTIKERFKINLQYDLNDNENWRDKKPMVSSILAADGAYSLVSGVTLYIAPPAIAGCFTNLNKVNYLDFTRPWWSQHINSNIEVNDRLYMASGFFDMPTVARADVTYFSTEMLNNYNLGSVYDLVYDGTWTFDKMLEMAQTAASDLDGNGIYDEKDQYGITSQWDVFGIQITTTGYTYATNHNDGTITLTGYNDSLIKISEKIYDLLYNSTYYYSGYTYQGQHNYDNMMNIFTDNRALFLMNGIDKTQYPAMREMGTYGILPTPKFSDSQEEYGTFTSAFVSAIPIDFADYECSAIILEALEAESYKQVLPAYYDIALSNKYLNDEDSVNMLNIIYDNTYCDFTYIYAESGLDTALAFSVGIIKDYVSWYESKAESYNTRIAAMVEKINALPD